MGHTLTLGLRVLLTGSLLAFASVSWAYPISGVSPDQRPEGAPVIDEVSHPEGWREEALSGVSEPYPASLGFLADQGHWYTPFNRPNMPGPYDIRGLYGSAEGGAE